MKRTHNEAIELFKQGKIDQAWEVAQQDEGLNADVTKEDWLMFADQCLKNRAELEAAQKLHQFN